MPTAFGVVLGWWLLCVVVFERNAKLDDALYSSVPCQFRELASCDRRLQPRRMSLTGHGYQAVLEICITVLSFRRTLPICSYVSGRESYRARS